MVTAEGNKISYLDASKDIILINNIRHFNNWVIIKFRI
jgi:hypothetical protein